MTTTPTADSTAVEQPLEKDGIPVGFLISLAVCVFAAVGLFTSVGDIASGLWTIALMVSLMFMGVPIAISMMIASGLGIYYVSGGLAVTNVLQSTAFSASSSWSMTVIPLFIFMGLLLTHAGLTQRLYRATELWFGWLPGGLGVGTTVAGAGLASVSGSTIGMTYALGRAGIPEMLRAGYDRRVAVGTIIVSGLPGQLIPPSILLVVYAGIASVPVGPQLMAGILPGIGIAIMYAVVLCMIGILLPRLVGRSDTGGATGAWGAKFRALGAVWAFPAVIFVLFGGIFSGTFTPSEAAAASAALALILAIGYTWRDRPHVKIPIVAMNAVRATAAIFFILIGAHMLTRMLAVTGIAESVADFMIGLGLGRIAFLLVLVGIYVVMGMFFDTLAMVLLTVPVLMPTLTAMEVDPLWFGVFVVLLGELSMITPPVGVLPYVVHNVCKRREVNLGHSISLNDVFVSLVWFLPVAILFLIILILWPDLVLWLPSVSGA